ncbi:MAG: hypothetical protein ACLPVW_07405 [Terriglobales bacterium]
MRAYRRSIGLTVLLQVMVLAQQRTAAPIDFGDEPHHRLLLENSSVRVYKLTLRPGEATAPHYHGRFYIFVSLNAASIDTEVRGRSPIKSQLESGELRTSKGGFTIAERNSGPAPAEEIVIEPRDSRQGAKFDEPMASFRYHDAAVGAIFEQPLSRAYDMVIAAGGMTEKHTEKYNRLLIALTDLRLKDETEGTASQINENVGGVLWLYGGGPHTLSNIGDHPAHFITIEFP